ncbi:MAG: ROK family protein [Lactococcus raffinolactis]|uniref:ROK family protein n=2 Tax=Streptococcaceae TaxID=1300 RepID=A0A5R9CBD0_9LACT|nr:ROK family protein [Lactococcus raffinolactis]MCH4162708.1 ROK family protein [Lactococcus raffinolactis]MDN5414302.1 ROK family protein [Lactococcus raffinolactis]MDT2766384.1 ROK family protein [Lactococcus raffinolactis]MDT2789544.1 ROK family protein [Lactococcus raffinolactis]QIW51982.1 ROK family protein [Lactococcus raffinolactis]
MSLLTIDVGGTSIKYALFRKGALSQKGSFPTPTSLTAYYEVLTELVKNYEQLYQITGVAISSPGAVNKTTGAIEGASALPYIHHFDIRGELEARFVLPVSMENDANCAALAELKFGAAKGMKDVIFMVLGTGVGGAIVIDGKIRHGQHLFGGELGFMLMDDTHSFSELGTAIGMANRYKARTGKDLTGEAIFNLAHAGEEIAQEEMTVFLFNVAKGIFNLAYAFDPECIVIGGGVSQAEWLIPELEKELQKMLNKFRIAPFLPVIKACQYRNDANLVGAAVDFQQTFKAKVSD